MMGKKKYDFFYSWFPVFILSLFVLSFMACNSGEKKPGDENAVGNEVSENNGEQAGGDPFFESEEHDFGEINYGDEVGARFGFENRGGKPLVIERVSTGCGCTVAEYTEKPVAPGEDGFVEIIFDSRGKSGSQIQNARVYFKDLKKPVRLAVVAQVVKK